MTNQERIANMTTAEQIKKLYLQSGVLADLTSVFTPVPWMPVDAQIEMQKNVFGQHIVKFADGSMMAVDDLIFDRFKNFMATLVAKNVACLKKKEEDNKESRFAFISKCYAKYGVCNTPVTVMEVAVYSFDSKQEFEAFILKQFS